jgi:hypothetical protein
LALNPSGRQSMNPNSVTFDRVIISENSKKETVEDRKIEKVSFDKVKVKGRTLKFTEPIIADVSFTDNVYSCQNSEFGIITAAPKLPDCLKSFEEEIRFIYNEYALESDDKLTDDAKELKNKILHRIKA